MQRSKTYRTVSETFDQDELYTPLAKAGFISGTFDSDGYVDEMDTDAGRALITAAIKHLYTEEVSS